MSKKHTSDLLADRTAHLVEGSLEKHRMRKASWPGAQPSTLNTIGTHLLWTWDVHNSWATHTGVAQSRDKAALNKQHRMYAYLTDVLVHMSQGRNVAIGVLDLGAAVLSLFDGYPPTKERINRNVETFIDLVLSELEIAKLHYYSVTGNLLDKDLDCVCEADGKPLTGSVRASVTHAVDRLTSSVPNANRAICLFRILRAAEEVYVKSAPWVSRAGSFIGLSLVTRSREEADSVKGLMDDRATVAYSVAKKLSEHVPGISFRRLLLGHAIMVEVPYDVVSGMISEVEMPSSPPAMGTACIGFLAGLSDYASCGTKAYSSIVEVKQPGNGGALLSAFVLYSKVSQEIPPFLPLLLPMLHVFRKTPSWFSCAQTGVKQDIDLEMDALLASPGCEEANAQEIRKAYGITESTPLEYQTVLIYIDHIRKAAMQIEAQKYGLAKPLLPDRPMPYSGVNRMLYRRFSNRLRDILLADERVLMVGFPAQSEVLCAEHDPAFVTWPFERAAFLAREEQMTSSRAPRSHSSSVYTEYPERLSCYKSDAGDNYVAVAGAQMGEHDAWCARAVYDYMLAYREVLRDARLLNIGVIRKNWQDNNPGKAFVGVVPRYEYKGRWLAGSKPNTMATHSVDGQPYFVEDNIDHPYNPITRMTIHGRLELLNQVLEAQHQTRGANYTRMSSTAAADLYVYLAMVRPGLVARNLDVSRVLHPTVFSSDSVTTLTNPAVTLTYPKEYERPTFGYGEGCFPDVFDMLIPLSMLSSSEVYVSHIKRGPTDAEIESGSGLAKYLATSIDYAINGYGRYRTRVSFNPSGFAYSASIAPVRPVLAVPILMPNWANASDLVLETIFDAANQKIA